MINSQEDALHGVEYVFGNPGTTELPDGWFTGLPTVEVYLGTRPKRR